MAALTLEERAWLALDIAIRCPQLVLRKEDALHRWRSKRSMGFNDGGDLCLGFWKSVWDTHVVTFPHGASVLEIGCAEADWIGPMLAERPDLQITGIDFRSCERRGAIVCGDVLTHDFPAASFDAVVSVSTIEHIGLGCYDAPVDADGDIRTMDRIVSWLKPGGWVYFDVPYRPDGPYEVLKSHRTYDEPALQARLIRPGLVERYRMVHDPQNQDSPYIAVVCDRA